MNKQIKQTKKCIKYTVDTDSNVCTVKTSLTQPSLLTLGGGGVLPYISYIGMCRPKGYGF